MSKWDSFLAVISMAIFTILAAILLAIFMEGTTDKDISTAEEDKFHFSDIGDSM